MDLPVPTPGPFGPVLPPYSSQLLLSRPMLRGVTRNLDPVARAVHLAISMPRQWCGTYQAFEDDNLLPVSVTLVNLRPVGQMVDLRGTMSVGGMVTPLQGNLNASNDQLDLLPLANQLPKPLDSGGALLGLQGWALTGWEPPRLTSLGGTFELKAGCGQQNSKSLPISSLW